MTPALRVEPSVAADAEACDAAPLTGAYVWMLRRMTA